MKVKNVKKYNRDYLNKIIDIEKSGNLKKAFSQYYTYLSYYPNDLVANVNYANLLVKLNIVDEAITILNNIKKFPNYPGEYGVYINYIQLKILCLKEEYQEAYKLFSNNDALIINPLDEIFLKIKANIKISLYDEYKKMFI